MIKEVKKNRKFLPDSNNFLLEKKAQLGKDAPEFERVVFNRLFRDGDSVELNDLREDFYSTFDSFKIGVFRSLVKRGFYKENPTVKKSYFIIAAILALITVNIPLAILMFLFSKWLIGRTDLGDEADWRIDGLKLFLKNMSREFSWQAKELILVEKMIPYAIAFGYINKLMEQLKIHYPNYNPYWYVGVNPYYFSHSTLYSSFTHTIITAPAGSSGFSGGGFSGGGGGGGGGGSW